MPKIPNVYPMPNGTFRASVSLGFDPITGKRIQKFKNGFKNAKGSSRVALTYAC